MHTQLDLYLMVVNKGQEKGLNVVKVLDDGAGTAVFVEKTKMSSRKALNTVARYLFHLATGMIERGLPFDQVAVYCTNKNIVEILNGDIPLPPKMPLTNGAHIKLIQSKFNRFYHCTRSEALSHIKHEQNGSTSASPLR